MARPSGRPIRTGRSLKIASKQGLFIFIAPVGSPLPQKDPGNQPVSGQFPTRENRELSGAKQGPFRGRTGKVQGFIRDASAGITHE
jgi:hypothetical protein